MNHRHPNVFARFAAQSDCIRRRLESDADFVEMCTDYETAVALARAHGDGSTASARGAELYRTTAEELAEEIASALGLVAAEEAS